jgi:hypothetical protein
VRPDDHDARLALTAFSGLCTVGMTIADFSDSDHHGGDINLSGIQYIIGAPFIVVGAFIWLGGWALRRKNPGAAAPANLGERNDDSSDPPRDA